MVATASRVRGWDKDVSFPTAKHSAHTPPTIATCSSTLTRPSASWPLQRGRPCLPSYQFPKRAHFSLMGPLNNPQLERCNIQLASRRICGSRCYSRSCLPASTLDYTGESNLISILQPSRIRILAHSRMSCSLRRMPRYGTRLENSTTRVDSLIVPLIGSVVPYKSRQCS